MKVVEQSDLVLRHTPPAAFALSKLYGFAGLLDDYEQDKILWRKRIDMRERPEEIFKEGGAKKLLEYFNTQEPRFYISHKSKGVEYAADRHLGADKLLKRKPMLCLYQDNFILIHKDIAEKLLKGHIIPAGGEITPIILETRDGTFVNNDYYWLKAPTVLQEEPWAQGYKIRSYEEPGRFVWRYDTTLEGGFAFPILLLIKDLPKGDFWIGAHLKDEFKLALSARAKEIFDAHQSPYKKYQVRMYAEIYTKLEDTPLVPTFAKYRREVVGHSRPLNPGEVLPKTFDIGEVYFFHVSNDRFSAYIEARGKVPSYP